jgi:hypothetical protein
MARNISLRFTLKLLIGRLNQVHGIFYFSIQVIKIITQRISSNSNLFCSFIFEFRGEIHQALLYLIVEFFHWKSASQELK